jgi:hypothetical protein
MKIALRILLLIVAIAIGGVLDNYLLLGLELSKILFLGATCIAFGHLFHAVDNKIMGIK